GQTQTRSGDPPVGRARGAIEALEQMLAIRLRDPDSRVAYGDLAGAVPPGHPDVDRALLWRELDRVGHQVAEKLTEPLAIAVDDDRIVGVHLERDLLGLR